MAEVIKPPAHGDWCFIYICTNKCCGAEIKSFPGDIEEWKTDGCYTYHTKCPVCETYKIIPISLISPKIQRLILENKRPS